MLRLYDVIYNLINPICNAYADHYPITQDGQEKVYPYVEFSFTNAIPNNEFSNNYLLQVDVWNNKSGDIEEIETITDNIYNVLNKYQLNNSDMFLQINRNNPCRLTLQDPDINIQRRELRFLIKVYYKNLKEV